IGGEVPSSTRVGATGSRVRGCQRRRSCVHRKARTSVDRPLSNARQGRSEREDDTAVEATPSAAAQPLRGVRVLELGTMYAAPTAGRMLRDFGADVIKVEDPVVGDYARQWQPQHEGLAIGFARLNAGKRSVGLDLRQAEGRDVVRSLIAKCDVVIE